MKKEMKKMINKINITLSGFQGITTIEDIIGFQKSLSDSIPRSNSGYIDFNLERNLKDSNNSNRLYWLIKRTISYPYYGYQHD